jgi:hypothetical protein
MQTRLFADYFQILVLDEASETSLDRAWNDSTLSDRIVALRDVLGIRTEVNVDIEVDVEWSTEPPGLDAERFDHVAEASVEISSGRMVVMGNSDHLPDAHRVEVIPGWVRIRVQKSNLGNAVAADIESDESSETIERIRIDAWPAGPSGVEVLKRWQSE